MIGKNSYNSYFPAVVVGENESMIVHPRDSVRRLDDFVGIRPDITHRRTPSFRLELLDR